MIRELLAGVELELGDERARTHAAEMRAYNAISQRNLAIMGAVMALVVGAAAGAAITYSLTTR